jgi:hypothetical protein
MIAMLQNRGGTQEDGVKWYSVALTAPFLFDEEISMFLKELSERGSGMRAWVGEKRIPISDSPEHVAEYNEHFMWLMKNYDQLEEKFQSSMNLFKLDPLSIKHLFPFGRPAVKQKKQSNIRAT